MATIKKLDPFGKGGAMQIGGNQGAGSALIQTVKNGAAAGANAMLNKLNGTQGTSYVTAPQTQQVKIGDPYLYNAQSSFGESGSMTATNAANAGSGNVSVSPYLNKQYTNVSPKDYNAPTMPVYAGEYDPRASRDSYIQAINNAFDYAKPQDYNMYYGSQLDSIVNNVANRGQFSYDPNTDPVYQAYKKQYAREGQRATQDTMASAAGMTGGVPSSYAVSAAQQAGNYYASQMSDKLPELYNQAYNRYLQEYQNQLSALSAVNNAEQLRHNIWSGNNENQWKGVNMDYGIHRDTIGDAYNAATLDRSLTNDEWARYVDMLNQYNTDRNFNYGQLTDQMNWERQNESTGYERDWNEENRDYTRSVYDDETAYNRQQDMYNRAVEMAKLGDYSLMEQLGLDTTYIRALNEAGLTDLNNQAAARLMRSSGSSGSSGKSGGGSAAGGEPLTLDGENGGIDEASLNRITEIGDKAGENGGIVESEDDWNFLLQYFTERQLNEEYGLYPQSEAEDLQAAAEAQYMADLINQQYEEQLTPNQSANRALNKARHNNGAVTNPKDWKTLTDTYLSGDLNKAGYYFTGSSTAGLTGGDEARNAVLNGTVAPVSGDQAAALAAQKALSGTSDIAYGKSNAARNGTVRTAAGVSSEASASTSKPKVNTTGTPAFNTAADAKKYAQSHGVKMVDMKYYTEPEFLKYKMDNSDGSLKFYNSYRDYLSGYTSYLINKYGK